MNRAFVTIVCLAAIVTSCAEKSSNSTPTTPTSSVRQLTFSPDTTAPVGQSVGITLATKDQESEKITISIVGYNILNDFAGQQAPLGILGATGRVKWDGTLLAFDAFDSGDWLRDGGVVPDLCQPETSSAAVAGSTNGFCVQRPTAAPRLMGSGELYRLRLKPMPGVTSGTSRLDFVAISDRFPSRVVLIPFRGVTAQPRETPLDNYYGGTVTIR